MKKAILRLFAWRSIFRLEENYYEITELLEALNILEKEKEISKETLLDAIENSVKCIRTILVKADNIKVITS